MKAKITTKKLKESLTLLNTQSDECIFNINKSGIDIKLVNAANVSMIDCSYSKKEFESFNVKQPVKLGIDIKPILKAIKFNSPSTVIEIETESLENGLGTESKLHLIHDGFKDTIQLPDIASVRKEPKIPNIDFTGCVTIDRKRLIKILNKGNDYIIFEIVKGLFKTESENVPNNSHSETITDTAKGNARSLYMIEYILDVLKSTKSKEIEIATKTNYPCKLTFGIGEQSTISYLQAPRVESE